MTAGQPDPDAAAAPPFVHCVHWTPRKLVGGVLPATHADLVFSQAALKQARDHASSSPTAPIGGVLLGKLSVDPAGGRQWVLVETAVRAQRPLPEDASAEILDAILSEVIGPEDEGKVVGWYRTHGQTGVYLSAEEARLHETRFGELWQCALILLGSAEHPVGGVFQQTEGDGLSRSTYAPFYELVDPSSELTAAAKRTFAGWSNYETEGPVVLAGSRGVSAVIPSLAQAESAEPGSAEPGSLARPGTPPVPVEAPVAPPTVPRTTAPMAAAPKAVAPKAAVPTTTTPMAAAPRAAVPTTTTPMAAAPMAAVPTAAAPEAAAPKAAVPTTTEPMAGAPKTAAPTPGSTGQDADSEEDWSQVQIRRSLTAVGRTLGPSTGAGQTGTAPIEPIELVEEEEPNTTPGPAADVEVTSRGDGQLLDTSPAAGAAPPQETPPQETVPQETRAAEFEKVGRIEPIGLDLAEPEAPKTRSRAGGTSTFVGRSRRRSRVPPRATALAATGLIALLAGGWFVMNWVNGAPRLFGGEASPPTVATDELPATQDPETSAAGLTIGQRPLFPRGSDTSEPVEGEYVWAGPEMSDALLAEDGEASVTAASNPEPLEPADADAAGETTPTPGEPEAEGLVPTVTPPPDISNLVELSLDNPVVAAFEDALSIFRREATRYDSLRVVFDDQLAGCNALNLSYRSVKDSFRRLGSRFESARDQFAGPGLQAYRSAQRQITVIDVHYELSECPLPRGG